MAGVTKPPKSERKAFGQRLAGALTRAGKSRTALANDLGVSYGALGAWVRGDSDCPAGWIKPMAANLGVAARDLVEDPSDSGLRAVHEDAPREVDDAFARRVVEVLESPLTAPDLMSLLAEARARSQH